MKTYHKAGKINAKGQVSALCFKQPRAINLAVASWTLRDEAVTCSKCKEILLSPSSRAHAHLEER